MKDYKKILEGVVDIINTTEKSDIGFTNICAYIGENCPELKYSEDEWARKEMLEYCYKRMNNEFPSITIHQVKRWLTWLEKQGKQKQDPCDNCKDVMLNCHNFPCVKKRAFKQGKSVLEVINEENVDNANKVETKFKVKYAGREYNVLEVKDVSGVAFYGIEDEPNHIDYIKAENCERVDGYNIKESGSLYPTKSAMFSKQNPIDKVEPKFKVGDWVVNRLGDVWHIDSSDKKNYQVSDGKGNYNYFPISKQDKMHHWTIQDAKAGDVLVYKENIKGSNGIKYERICLFNNFDNAFFILTTVSNDVEGYDIDVNINYPDDIIPATKEQRDTLIKAMADAGYTFDFKYKESLKIRQNPAWSEEDEINLEKAIWYVENPASMVVKDSMLVEWLKSLKQRYTWKPSDEQMDALYIYIYNPQYFNPSDQRMELVESLYQDLKKLKEE